MNLPIDKSESNADCGTKDDGRKDEDDCLRTKMITNDHPIDDNNNTESRKGKKMMMTNDTVNGDTINMITDGNHESDEGDEMEDEDDDLISSSMDRPSSRHHDRLSTSLIADDEEASGHSGNTQGYYELDERRTKKRRKQSNPVRYGTDLCTKTSSRPFKNSGDDYEEDDLSRDQTDNFVNTSNNEDESMMVDDHTTSILGMTIRSSTDRRTNTLKRRYGKSSCADDEEETEEEDQEEADDQEEDEEDEGMDEPVEGDEDDEEPGQMDLSVAAAAAAAALNYSQLTKFHFLCPHCGCPFLNEDQLKDHIEEEHVQKVLEQQLLHHQQQLDSQQQYKKTPNGISSRHDPKHGPFIDGSVSRGQHHTRSRLSSTNRDLDGDMASSLGDSCSNSPLGSPNHQKTFDSSSLGSNNDNHSHHHLSHSQHHGSSHHSKPSSKHSMTIVGVSGTNNKNSGANSLTAGVTSVPSGSAKDFASLLSYKLHGVSGQQSTPTTSSSPSTGNHNTHHPSSSSSQLPAPHSSASQSGQLNCDDNSSTNNGKDNANSSSNVMPIAMFPYLFNILPGSNGSNCSNNSTGGNNNLNNGSLVGGNGAGVNLTSGAIHNGLGLAGLTAINPANVHQKIFNPEAYCELCNKELCNKYFLKTHKANKHGIYTSDPSPGSTGPGGSTSSSTVGAGSGSQAAQAAAVAAAFNTAAAAAYFQSAGGMPSGSAQAAAAMQMQQLLQQASASSNSNGGSGGQGGNGNGSNSGTPNIDSSNAAAIVALANRSVGMINMESYCDICQKKFCNKYFLKKHRSKIHNIHCSSSSSTSSISGNNPLMLTGPGSGYHGSNDHSLANLTGLALTAGSSSLDRNISNRSISPSDSSGQGGDSNGLTEAISLVSTKLPSSSPQLSPSSIDHRSTPLTNKHPNDNSQSAPLKMTSSTVPTSTIATAPGNSLVLSDREKSSKQVNPSSIQSFSVNSSPSSSPSTTITTVSTSNCLPNNSNNGNCDTYCDLCRTDLGNQVALHAHRIMVHSLPPQGSPSSSWTRDQWQAMMSSLQAESFALLGRSINVPPGSAGENIIFTPEKLREMGVINADAFCEICKKEFCNKYFLRTHKANKHGIGTIDTASNCGSTKSNTSGHHKGEGKEDGSQRGEDRIGGSDREIRNHHDFNFSGRQSISFPEDNSMSPRSSGNDDSNQRRPSPSNTPNDLIFTSSPRVTISSTPSGDTLRPSSSSPTQQSSSQVTLNAVNSLSSNQGNMVPSGNGIPTTSNSDYELVCEICGKNFQSKSSLRAHRINIHGIRINNTNNLPGRSSSTSNRRDTDNRSPESPKNCLSDKNTSQAAAAAFALTNRQFGMEGLMSVKCGPSTSSSSNGSRSSNTGRNYCNICNKELCNKYFMKTHMKKMHQIDIDEHPAGAAFTSSVGGVTCDICQKELCSKYFLKVHKLNTHGIGEDTPNGMKDGSRGGLSGITGPGMNLLIPGTSGLVANLPNNVLTPSSSSSPLGSHHHHHPHHHQPSGSTSNSVGGGGSGGDASGKRVDGSRGGNSGGGSGGGGGMDGAMDCTSGITSDADNSIGIDPSDTGNRYFSHYTEVCPLCERRFKSIKWLKTHMTNDHSDLIPIRPSGNGQSSSSSSNFPLLNNPELTASAFLSGHDLSRMCVMCGQICSDRSSLQMHLIKDHKTSPEELAALTGANLFGLNNFGDIASEATDLSSPINKSSSPSSSNANNNSSNNNTNVKNSTRNTNNTSSNDNDNSNEVKPESPSTPSISPDNLMNQHERPSIHNRDPMDTVRDEIATLSQALQVTRARMKELRNELERERNAHAITKDKLAQHGSELTNLRNSLQLVIEQQRLEVETLQAKLKKLDSDLHTQNIDD